MTQATSILARERIELEVEGTCAELLTFDRPESLNPMDWELFKQLEGALVGANDDPTVRAVLITGRGRAFSAGGDLKAYVELQRDRVAFPQFLEDAHRTFLFMRSMSKPVVSLVNGVTAAGGLETILFSDFAIAARSARIGDSHLTYGMMGGGGVLTMLPRAIGAPKARELVFSGRLLSAQEAVEWGIVNREVDDDRLLEAGIEIANEIARKSPLAVANAKLVMNTVSFDGSSVEAGMRYERERTARYCLTSEDAQEGLAAFAEKRRPKFRGV